MLTGKQRSYLKKLAHDLEPTVFIGKSGLTENIKNELETGFESRELVKVKIQEGSELKAKETANQLNLCRPLEESLPSTDVPTTRTSRRLKYDKKYTSYN